MLIKPMFTNALVSIKAHLGLELCLQQNYSSSQHAETNPSITATIGNTTSQQALSDGAHI